MIGANRARRGSALVLVPSDESINLGKPAARRLIEDGRPRNEAKEKRQKQKTPHMRPTLATSSRRTGGSSGLAPF